MTPTALFVWGGWEGHEPKQCAEYMARILTAHGYRVRVESDLQLFTDSALMRSLDLIVPVFTGGSMTEEQERGLVDAVSTGTGLGGWHGMTASFRENRQYAMMTGGQFIAHPGNIIDYTVTVTVPDHSIVAEVAGFAVHSEQYFLHVDPSNEVLATTTFSGEHLAEVAGTVMPVVWTRRWGQGKVFYSALGHSAAELEREEVCAITERGLVWATHLRPRA